MTASLRTPASPVARWRRPTLASLALATLGALGACATTGVTPTAAPSAAPAAAGAPARAAAAPVAADASAAARPAPDAASAPARAAGTPAGAGAGTPPARPDAAAPRPFAEVIKDATRQDGLVPLWRKDERVWLEIAPEQLGRPLLLSVNIAQSVGERGLYGSQMGPRWLVNFRRVGNQMQLLARQQGFRGDRDAAAAQAVGQAFSDSLLAGTPVLSAPHPERKSVLVDAAFLLGDLAGYGTRLEAAFRLPYAVDRANSFFGEVRAEPGLTTLSAQVHYSVARLPAPPMPTPGAPPAQQPPRVMPPATTPDARSLFVGYVFNLRELPAQPMRARSADGRVGYFTDSWTDLSDDLLPETRRHAIKRWRLEKKDPQAALSEPVRPITYWMDRNIPDRYRASVREGILAWNKAFERIGFKDAIVVRQQTDADTFDTLDAGHASVRWFVGADVGFAIGPSHSDPRSGEILDADIGMSDVFARGARRLAREDLYGDGPAPAWREALQAFGADDGSCRQAELAAQELGLALDLLAARGDADPQSPEAEALAQGYVKAVMIHEVGHTLGLRHNFRASTTVTREQLKDRAFTAERGTAGSVMDYNAFNLPLEGEPARQASMTTLGSYDYWAIEYGYKPLAPEEEAAGLKTVLERSRSDPGLAFADDGDSASGLDPRVNIFDLGDDPLDFVQRRLLLTQQLWARLQKRGLQPGDDALRLRRSLLESLRQLQRMPVIAAKHVSGVYIERDPLASGRPGYRPVEGERQRAALRLVSQGFMAEGAFRLEPAFLANLLPDYIGFDRAPFSLPQAVLALQAQLLDALLDPAAARRLLEAPMLLAPAERAGRVTLNEVYGSLQQAVWAELRAGRAIDPMRRNLQREHLRRVQATLLRPTPVLPADALSLTRLRATELQAQLRNALRRPGWAVEDRAHLLEALDTLTEALRAPLQRAG